MKNLLAFLTLAISLSAQAPVGSGIQQPSAGGSGTITGVTAGTGLSGGGTSGAVTITYAGGCASNPCSVGGGGTGAATAAAGLANLGGQSTANVPTIADPVYGAVRGRTSIACTMGSTTTITCPGMSSANNGQLIVIYGAGPVYTPTGGNAARFVVPYEDLSTTITTCTGTTCTLAAAATNASGPAITVGAATNASPIQITSVAPVTWLNGASVTCSGIGGNTAANGTFTIAVIDAKNFTLNSSTGNAAYTSGGSCFNNGGYQAFWGPSSQTAIQAALTACTGGANVTVPTGVFMYTASLNMSTGCNLVFQGVGSILQATNYTSENINVASTDTISGNGYLGGVIVARTNVIGEAGIAVGNSPSTYVSNVGLSQISLGHQSGAAVSVEEANHVLIDKGVNVSTVLANAYYVSSQSSYVNILDTVSSNTGDNCWEYTTTAIDANPVTHGLVEGNTCDYSWAGGGSVDATKNVQYIGNTVFQPQTFGFFVGNDGVPAVGLLAYDISLLNNIVDGANALSGGSQYSMYLDYFQRLTVSGNIIKNGPGIYENPETTASTDLKILNNALDLITGNAIFLGGNVTNASITGNTCDGVAQGASSYASCVWVTNTDGAVANLSVTGNTGIGSNLSSGTRATFEVLNATNLAASGNSVVNQTLGVASGIATTGSTFAVSSGTDQTVHSLGQNAAANFGGTCAMSASTSCTITIAHPYTTPVCIATQQSATLTGASVGCTVSGTTVTITATTANSETWGAIVFGNPN